LRTRSASRLANTNTNTRAARTDTDGWLNGWPNGWMDGLSAEEQELGFRSYERRLAPDGRVIRNQLLRKEAAPQAQIKLPTQLIRY